MGEKLDEYLELEERLRELRFQDPFPEFEVDAVLAEISYAWDALTDEERKIQNERTP